jgi:muscarinic acetylcholine receptor M3
MISFKIDKQLQTISNYFLFSLAIADFAIGLISMPLFTLSTILGHWPLGPFVCDTWLALDYLASNASVLNLLIISFDRYFSVTRPLTYRAKRTTSRAAFMIASAWGISLLLWPPWIYSWPYIEGKRTVPEYECYIQFIETNQYITFGTAIAAFYVPGKIKLNFLSHDRNLIEFSGFFLVCIYSHCYVLSIFSYLERNQEKAKGFT